MKISHAHHIVISFILLLFLVLFSSSSLAREAREGKMTYNRSTIIEPVVLANHRSNRVYRGGRAYRGSAYRSGRAYRANRAYRSRAYRSNRAYRYRSGYRRNAVVRTGYYRYGRGYGYRGYRGFYPRSGFYFGAGFNTYPRAYGYNYWPYRYRYGYNYWPSSYMFYNYPYRGPLYNYGYMSGAYYYFPWVWFSYKGYRCAKKCYRVRSGKKICKNHCYSR